MQIRYYLHPQRSGCAIRFEIPRMNTTSELTWFFFSIIQNRKNGINRVLGKLTSVAAYKDNDPSEPAGERM